MCGNGHDGREGREGRSEPVRPPAFVDDPSAGEAFPWHTGRVYDAHCHPTDTMASLAMIPTMGAARLTVMSTRAQDQDLVAALADEQGVAWDGHGLATVAAALPRKVVPAFGWHPWFAHQLYDDTGNGDGPHDALTSMDAKRRHLAAVLTPSPSPLPSADGASTAATTKSTADLVAAGDALAASLSAIRPLSALLAETRARLLAHPAALIGEIGIDKAFRVPEPYGSDDGVEDPDIAPGITPGGREGRRLSPFRVQPTHQAAVFTAQLRLAAELCRPVSVHGVQAHGLLFSLLAATWRGHERDVLSRRQWRQIAGVEGLDEDEDDTERGDDRPQHPPTPAPPYPPAICLHSFSGPVDMLKQYLDPRVPAAIYFSFSTAINCGTAHGRRRMAEVVAACPDDRILLESDLHTAGPEMEAMLEDIYRRVCAVKKWTLAEGVERIAQNYDAFLQRRTTPARQ